MMMMSIGSAGLGIVEYDAFTPNVSEGMSVADQYSGMISDGQHRLRR